jgi:hypothetical protein
MRITGTHFRKSLCVCLAVFVCGASTMTYALDPDSPVAKREAQKMRAVLEENFQACNEENLKKLLGTTSRFTGTPQQMAEFATEAKQMFESCDVYMRLVDFTADGFRSSHRVCHGHPTHAPGQRAGQ